MAQFWLATFATDLSTSAPAVGAILPPEARNLAIEVLKDGTELAVLISSVDDLEQPTALTCHLGFANVAKACNVWLDRGFPLIDAAITMDDTTGVIRIVSPFFIDNESVMQYEMPILSLSGVELGESTAQVPASGLTKLAPLYRQHLSAPDSAQPDLLVRKRPVSWLPVRTGVQKRSAKQVPPIGVNLGQTPARCPVLTPLETADIEPAAVWSGKMDLPKNEVPQDPSPAKPSKVIHTFGAPAFRFENVEVLGFRINLAELARDYRHDLERLVGPLNFHLFENATDPASGEWRMSSADFRYRAATPTLVIELLRYGRMKARVPAPPLDIEDSQSQHELLVRLLVGRVDDDTAQARAPAMYVPAIFVDNPWSKTLGRDAVGFDKRLADFCVIRKDKFERLLPDGRLANPPASQTPGARNPEPLGDIRRISLVDRTGGGTGEPLLDLRLPTVGLSDTDSLKSVDLDLTLGPSVLAGTRWRQSDFDAAEFRRSFATLAMADNLRAFRTIQVAPVAVRGDFKLSWITGTMRVDPDLRADLPGGVASLVLHAVLPDETRPTSSQTPKAWNTLCRMLGGGERAEVTLPGGSWYRLVCSMNLTIDDGLDWSVLNA
jgi:hypothetical protein